LFDTIESNPVYKNLQFNTIHVIRTGRDAKCVSFRLTLPKNTPNHIVEKPLFDIEEAASTYLYKNPQILSNYGANRVDNIRTMTAIVHSRTKTNESLNVVHSVCER